MSDTRIAWHDEDAIRDLLMGHSIEKVADDHLRLDDGTMLEVVPNWGGCCGAGDYVLTNLNGCPNIITKVETLTEDLTSHDGWVTLTETAYRVFIYAENQRINLLSVEGDDGNGYYGTGYDIVVKAMS